MVFKVCTKCGEAKGRAGFTARAACRDGLRGFCKDCRRRQNAAYRAAHRTEHVAYEATHREEMATHYAAYRVAYHAAHREQRNVANARRRARRSQVGGLWTVADKLAQIARQKDGCFYCKRKLCKGESFHFDHVVPLAGERTSWNGPENMVAACPTCNMKKSATDPMDFAGIMF